MNIIANTCIGGYIYTNTNNHYGNPFIWNNILAPDFIKLVNLYDQINFLNYSIFYEYTQWHDRGVLPKDTLVTTVNIDNLINIRYTHHLYCEKYNNMFLLQPSNRLMSNNMKDYVNQLYIKRIHRMLNFNEKPIFVYFEQDDEKELETLLKTNRDNVIIMTFKYNTKITEKMEVYNFNDIRQNPETIRTNEAAKWLIKNSKILAKYLI